MISLGQMLHVLVHRALSAGEEVNFLQEQTKVMHLMINVSQYNIM